MAKTTLHLLGGLLLAACTASAVPLTITSGSDVTINFNGFSDDTVIDGLTSTVQLSNFSFTYNGGTNQTMVSFDYDIWNTSTAPITDSSVTNFAFNTNPDVLGGSVSGIFNTVQIEKNQPNGIGKVEVCYTASNCPGGGAGVDQGGTGSGSALLYFGGNVSSFTLDSAYVRYQSVDGGGFMGGSASGAPVPGGEIPEPSTYALISLGLAGIAMVGRRRAA